MSENVVSPVALIHSSSSTLTAGDPDLGGVLVGSFTGTVEADGLIQLADLTSFTVIYSDSAAPDAFVAHTVHALQLFSYDTNGGPSSFDFATSRGSA